MAKSRKPESVRLNLEVSPHVRERLERLREDTEAESLTEVIRRALAVYESLAEVAGSTKRIIIRDKNGDERELLLVP